MVWTDPGSLSTLPASHEPAVEATSPGPPGDPPVPPQVLAAGTATLVRAGAAVPGNGVVRVS